jgi:hypothetical protein
LEQKPALNGRSHFLPFLLLARFYTVITLSALTYAIEWQVNKLGLRTAVFVLAFLLCATGGAFLSNAYSRVINYRPPPLPNWPGTRSIRLTSIPIWAYRWRLSGI